MEPPLAPQTFQRTHGPNRIIDQLVDRCTCRIKVGETMDDGERHISTQPRPQLLTASLDALIELEHVGHSDEVY